MVGVKGWEGGSRTEPLAKVVYWEIKHSLFSVFAHGGSAYHLPLTTKSPAHITSSALRHLVVKAGGERSRLTSPLTCLVASGPFP